MLWNQNLTTKQYLFWAISWTIIILIIVGIPGNQIPRVSKFIDLFQPDKIVHLAMFAPFSYLWALYIYGLTSSRKRSVYFVLVLGMFYAIISELLQKYVFIGRNANVPDAIADIVGVIVGIVVFTKNIPLNKRKSMKY
jgi:VanZ family protein